MTEEQAVLLACNLFDRTGHPYAVLSDPDDGEYYCARAGRAGESAAQTIRLPVNVHWMVSEFGIARV